MTASTLDKIRLLIADDSDAPHFTDGQLNTFYALALDSLYIACALALESWSASLNSDAESEHIGDYSYSKKTASNKLELAKHFRDLEDAAIAAAADVPVVDWAEMALESVGEYPVEEE